MHLDAEGCYTEHSLSSREVFLIQLAETNDSFESSVNYDEAPVAALEVAGLCYRVDVGHGSAVAISQRPVGTWTWTPLVEGRWDGSRLKAKGLSLEVRTALAEALGSAMRDQRALQD